jgi:hypothetical protein
VKPNRRSRRPIHHRTGGHPAAHPSRARCPFAGPRLGQRLPRAAVPKDARALAVSANTHTHTERASRLSAEEFFEVGLRPASAVMRHCQCHPRHASEPNFRSIRIRFQNFGALTPYVAEQDLSRLTLLGGAALDFYFHILFARSIVARARETN